MPLVDMVMDETFPFFLDFDARVELQVGHYLSDVVKGEKTEYKPVNGKNYQEGENHGLNDGYTYKRL